ncbi:Stc1 domain-containing protein [Xylaria sp. FL1777]|nr:Stc1 domain-containing protein [Xylaria sp. FL1777]
MAPPPSSGGVSLPRSFTCRVCGKDKPSAAYSKTQIQKWFNKKRNDRYNAITPQNVGLTCKDHSSDQREIRCHGPCDRIKVVDHFSKKQRNEPEPWCIDCTEWRLNFNGNELPTAPPNEPLAHHEYDGIPDDDDDKFRQQYPQRSFDGDSSDEDVSSDDDYEYMTPYDEPTIITNVVDRLQGYGFADADEGTNTDVASTTDNLGASRWGQYANANRSNSGPGISARTVTSIQPSTMQSRGRLNDASMASDARGNASHLQGYPLSTSGTTIPTGVAPHLNRLASRPGMNHQPQMARTHILTQPGQFMGLGESAPTLSSRYSAGRPHSSQAREKEGGRTAIAVAHEPPSSWKPNVKNRESRKENSNKWYKGDNRKVFPSNKRVLGDRVQDGTEAAHDSDSPDEM